MAVPTEHESSEACVTYEEAMRDLNRTLFQIAMARVDNALAVLAAPPKPPPEPQGDWLEVQ